jgi:hypothetical protein
MTTGPRVLFERRAEHVANVVPGREHQPFETLHTLLVAWSILGSIGAAESKELAADDDVDVLGEAVDQLPSLGE